MTDKLPLRRYLMRRAMLGSLVALLLMLSLALLTADRMALYAAAHSMLNDLSGSDSPWMVQGRGQGLQRGRRVFTPDGEPVDMGYGQGRGWGWGRLDRETGYRWPVAAEVDRKGSMTGVGALPWLPEPVAWAGVAVTGPQGQRWVVVAWNRASAIRSAIGFVYLLIGLSVLVTYLIAMAFLSQSLQRVSESLRGIAQAGREMVKGDFSVRVPQQQTRELAELGGVVNELAQHLDAVIQQLQAETHRLRQLESLQRQFVADASHELRAPLSSMAMTLDAWRDGLLADQERDEAVRQLRREVTRLSTMVEQLLDLSRIESGRQPLHIGDIPVREAVNEVVRSYAHQPGAPVSVSIEPGVDCVRADPDALHRVLRNILDNARRFTPADGSITVHASADGARVCIRVADTGVGMTAEDVERVWERFARSERERASGAEGTGLGLAIVKALLTAMNGDTRLESRLGEGTSVSIWLPAGKCEMDLSETRDT